MTVHPTSVEIRNALVSVEPVADVVEHLEACLACRVLSSRISQIESLPVPSAEIVERVLAASEAVPGVEALAHAVHGGSPEAGELWRVGRDDAMLVWVRKNLRDGAVDVVPVVLDLDFADDYTILVPASASPLSAELAVMVTLRTHVHEGVFIDRLGLVSIATDVEEVVAAQREGRPASAAVGLPIENDLDSRYEFRQALRDFLAELSPSAWVEGSRAQAHLGADESGLGEDATEAIKAEISERLLSAQFTDLQPDRYSVSPGCDLEAAFCVAFLDTAVLVVTAASMKRARSDVVQLADACSRAVRNLPDVGAVCVSSFNLRGPSVLFSRASLRDALEVPGGRMAGPTPILVDLDLVDTLCKHLDGSAVAWEVTEAAPRDAAQVDVHLIASKHVQTAMRQVQLTGQRSPQPAKKSAWTDLPPGLADHVSRFVVAVSASDSLEDAYSRFEREIHDDPHPEAD